MPWLAHGFQKPHVIWKGLGLQDPDKYLVRYQQSDKKEVNYDCIDHTTQRKQLLGKTGRQISWLDHKRQIASSAGRSERQVARSAGRTTRTRRS